jgi:hypothetical protein
VTTNSEYQNKDCSGNKATKYKHSNKNTKRKQQKCGEQELQRNQDLELDAEPHGLLVAL